MRLEDADITRDDIKWDVECDECGTFVRWIGTVKVRGLRILDDKSLGWVVVRVCLVCAGRAILLPERKPIKDDCEMKYPYLRPIAPDPHDREDIYDAPTSEPDPPPAAA